MKHTKVVKENGGGAVYGLGLIGSLVYYILHYNNIGDFLFGVVKSIFWPAFVVYKLVETLGI